MKTNILITGVAGFIGSHLAIKLLKDNPDIVIIGIDNMNEYYDIELKKDRLKIIKKYKNFKFIKCDINNRKKLDEIIKNNNIKIVVNLAAQAGVRYSLTNPDTYITSNILGFYNILEVCKDNSIEHLIYASSSSVYGDNKKVPFKENDKTDYPVSLYAATKKCDEILAYSYSKIYNINITGLRFFTVYGPFGRPDMAYFSFTNKLINGEKIKVYNQGKCKRDFTYIDDVVETITKIIAKKTKRKNLYETYNIGASHPENLIDFINILKDELINEGLLEKNFDITKNIILVEKQKGDVDKTYADTTKIEKYYKYKPKTSLKEGLNNFVKWYKEYYK